MDHEADRLLTPHEVAALFSVSPRTLRRIVAAGDLPAVRIGGSVRFRPESIDHYVTTHEHAA